MGISNIVFILLFALANVLFIRQARKIIRNIKMGKSENRSDNPGKRWKTMARVALGQGKMVTRPVAGILHILVYVGFVIINIEVVEIIIDGIFGTHRILSFMGGFYNFLIASFEILAILVLVSCVLFFIRRNVVKVKRFHYKEMLAWPKNDANLILVFEILLMSAFLLMDGADALLQSRGVEGYHHAGMFPVSSALTHGFLGGLDSASLILLERSMWWFHIIGIFGFMNYLPISKHLHIILAFPNTYFSNLEPKGRFTNMESVTNEVKLMMDPSADPFAAPAPAEGEIPSFGAKDVQELSWKNLLDAYTCTECGRCSSSCPATQTGKMLSPRKIMMDTRDRLEEVGKNLDKGITDSKKLLGDYITEEEIWACTSCNACTDACPVNIDPLNIIVELRRNLVMEDSKAPMELTTMFNNMENNGAPWAFSPADRFNWIQED
ncbi:MAG: heterodisulfide reductase subunit C [Luteibaculaceae bacterium]|jgi:heterodisulfide reductase subunit C